jgi:hypothetical protein
MASLTRPLWAALLIITRQVFQCKNLQRNFISIHCMFEIFCNVDVRGASLIEMMIRLIFAGVSHWRILTTKPKRRTQCWKTKTTHQWTGETKSKLLRHLLLVPCLASSRVFTSFTPHAHVKWLKYLLRICRELIGCFSFQYEILKEGMKVHAELVTDALRPFHENLEKRFNELHALIPKTPRKTYSRVRLVQWQFLSPHYCECKCSNHPWFWDRDNKKWQRLSNTCGNLKTVAFPSLIGAPRRRKYERSTISK